jgi:hypothetical protein
MRKPILNTWLFEGGPLEGLRLFIEQIQTIVSCIEVAGGVEVKHFYEWHGGRFEYKSNRAN